MKKNILLVILFAISNSWSLAQPVIPSYLTEQNIIERINWFYDLKRHIGNAAWPDLDESKATLVYYTDSSSFIVHPTKEIIYRFELKEVSNRNEIKIYKSKSRIDDIAFHMSTGYGDDDSSKIYFKNPTMLCSDIESAKKVIEDLNSLQNWATILMHEYFHGFQFTYTRILEYSKKITVPDRKLQYFYDEVPAFKNKIDGENDILLKSITANKRECKRLLRGFIFERETRRKHFSDSLNIDFNIIEDYYEKIEGSARYSELELYKSISTIQVNKWLQHNDNFYDSNAYSNFKIEDVAWTYQTASSSKYFYATGFNLLRVLDKIGVDYKKAFFRVDSSPYSILKKTLKYPL